MRAAAAVAALPARPAARRGRASGTRGGEGRNGRAGRVTGLAGPSALIPPSSGPTLLGAPPSLDLSPSATDPARALEIRRRSRAPEEPRSRGEGRPTRRTQWTSASERPDVGVRKGRPDASRNPGLKGGPLGPADFSPFVGVVGAPGAPAIG